MYGPHRRALPGSPALLLALVLAGCAPALKHASPGRPWARTNGPGGTRHVRDYLTPRCWPDTLLDPRFRPKALWELKRLHEFLKQKHIPYLVTKTEETPAGPTKISCAWVPAGPTNLNGRVTGIAVDPNNAEHVFTSTVGGFWRSTDGGRVWERVSDDFRAGVFACVAVNPENGDEVFAGTGDPNLYWEFGYAGEGLWLSSRAAESGSFTQVGHADMSQAVVFRVRLDPSPPTTDDLHAYAATDKGLFLGKRDAAGAWSWGRLGGMDAVCSDLAVDLGVTPRVVYAAVAQGSSSYGNGIWRYDGTSWKDASDGIDTGPGAPGVIALALAKTDVLYAKVENVEDGSLLGVFKTTTGGTNPAGSARGWTNVAPSSPDLDDSDGYTWFNCVVEVDPSNPDHVYVGGIRLYRSTNGGSSWEDLDTIDDPAFKAARPHDDQHAIAFMPRASSTDPRIVLAGNDGGIDRSTDLDASPWHWESISHGMQITEYYRGTTHDAVAGQLAGGTQDNGTGVTFGNRTWYSFADHDGDEVQLDAPASSAMYDVYNGDLRLVKNPVPGTDCDGDAVPAYSTSLEPSSPVAADAKTKGRALAAGSKGGLALLIGTTDGLTWAEKSPQLAAGAEITAIAMAPSDAQNRFYLAFTSGDQAYTWSTTDGGTTWPTTSSGAPSYTELTSSLAGLRPNGIAVDWTTPGRAFLALGGERGGSGAVAMTTDGGANWTALPGSGGTALPSTPVTGVVVSPYDANVIYVSTGTGPYQGTLTGASASWAPFDEGLPEGVEVNDITVNQAAGTLAIFTMGYGAFIRDVRPDADCYAATLTVRDNVYDRGFEPSPSGNPDPEWPIRDSDPLRACTPTTANPCLSSTSIPCFYKPADDYPGRVYWWESTDIRIYVPPVDENGDGSTADECAADPNCVPGDADHVEFETCPTRTADCPPGTMIDANPRRGTTARVHVQVTNRGLQTATNLQVIALYANASVGLPDLPAGFWGTTFPASGSCGALAAGTAWSLVDAASPCRDIAEVRPDRPQVVGFDWNVPAGAAEHTCVLAMIDCADDPIPAAVRAADERRVSVLVPNHRQIALRNLHVEDPPAGSQTASGVVAEEATNSTGSPTQVDLLVSRPGLPPGARLVVFLQAPDSVRVASVPVPVGFLAPTESDSLKAWDLDIHHYFPITADEDTIPGILIGPYQTRRIGVKYDLGRYVQPKTTYRFNLLAQRRREVLGGGSYLIRMP